MQSNQSIPIQVDVIIPVHNAADTLEATVRSAMEQHIPQQLLETDSSFYDHYELLVTVCCYDDGSTDDSWSILQRLYDEYTHSPQHTNTITKNNSKNNNNTNHNTARRIPINILIAKSPKNVGRGAGYARNRAIELNSKQDPQEQDPPDQHWYLCFLDSDDTMQPSRVAEQTQYLVTEFPDTTQRDLCLLGCQFQRTPSDATWHYSAWANGLSDARLGLERYREVTVLQPTWFVTRARWKALGGYNEGGTSRVPEPELPINPNTPTTAAIVKTSQSQAVQPQQTPRIHQRLIHPLYDDATSLKLAEDLRFFHEHLAAGGVLRLYRGRRTTRSTTPATTTATGAQTKTIQNNTPPDHPLVTYRHTETPSSQSVRTSRKLLVHLRAFALERTVLQQDWGGRPFVVWGAGRDGKAFVKALSPAARHQLYCFVDVDAKKLTTGRYQHRALDVDVPIIHFSFLIRDPTVQQQYQQDYYAYHNNNQSSQESAITKGRIDKTRKPNIPPFESLVPSSVDTTTTKTCPPSSLRSNQHTTHSQSHTCTMQKKKRKVRHEENRAVTTTTTTTTAHTPSPSSPSPLPAVPVLTLRGLSAERLHSVPVVVCVAMYRTQGVLEQNVAAIGRTEGHDLWHFS